MSIEEIIENLEKLGSAEEKFEIEDFGKTVFLTRQEAEAALREEGGS